MHGDDPWMSGEATGCAGFAEEPSLFLVIGQGPVIDLDGHLPVEALLARLPNR